MGITCNKHSLSAMAIGIVQNKNLSPGRQIKQTSHCNAGLDV